MVKCSEKRCEICSNLTINISEDIVDVVLVSLLFTLNKVCNTFLEFLLLTLMFAGSNVDFEHSQHIDLVFLLLVLNVLNLLSHKIRHKCRETYCSVVEIVKSFKESSIGFYKPKIRHALIKMSSNMYIHPKTTL